MRGALMEVLICQSRLRIRVAELAGRITADYEGRDLVLIGVLKGAVVFLSDLMRKLDIPVSIEFISASSYGECSESSGEVEVKLTLGEDIKDKHVLIIEDIVDTGRTLTALVAETKRLGAASVKTCCLLDKPSRRAVEFEPDYVGFEIPDQFVVGYGLDFNEHYRNLPYVAVLKPEAYQ